MAGYQLLTLVGNVGRDPELRYTSSGIAVADFSLAVNRTWTDKDTNEKREEVTWFRVTAWRGLAETVNQYVYKGMQIMVTGRVGVSAYINKQGEPAASLEVTADNIVFLGRREADNGSGEEPSETPNFSEDDLPF